MYIIFWVSANGNLWFHVIVVKTFKYWLMPHELHGYLCRKRKWSLQNISIKLTIIMYVTQEKIIDITTYLNYIGCLVVCKAPCCYLMSLKQSCSFFLFTFFLSLSFFSLASLSLFLFFCPFFSLFSSSLMVLSRRCNGVMNRKKEQSKWIIVFRIF